MALDEFGLTLKQRDFCDEYLISGNATQSAIKAGYSKNTARAIGGQNLTKVAVKSYVDSRRAKVAEKYEITQEYVLNGIKEIHEFNKEKETITAGEGENVYMKEKMRDANVSLRAAEMLGKSVGVKLFVEQKDINIVAEIQVDNSERKKDLAKRLFLSLNDPCLLGELVNE
tara:strand:+ start:278 stop:790 length:513 start_codon:yes stop_codon:yes gene_type:complete